MSYDITFWKPKPSASPDPQATYERLNRNEPSEDLESLPLPQIIEKLREAFPDFDPTEENPDVRLQDGSMEISYTAQSFRFDFRPPMATGKGRVWHVMSRFACVCYDPQTGKLHDSDNPPDYADLKADLGWLLNPGRMRETSNLKGVINRASTRLILSILPTLLAVLFVVSAIVAAVITAFVYLIRWVISLFAAAV